VGGGVIKSGLELPDKKPAYSLERNRVNHGCSYGNANWLTPSLASPLADPGLVFKSLVWLLNGESPLYVQPRLDPSLLR
jgi:D-amino-acid dehydrogenase